MSVMRAGGGDDVVILSETFSMDAAACYRAQLAVNRAALVCHQVRTDDGMQRMGAARASSGRRRGRGSHPATCKLSRHARG